MKWQAGPICMCWRGKRGNDDLVMPVNDASGISWHDSSLTLARNSPSLSLLRLLLHRHRRNCLLPLNHAFVKDGEESTDDDIDMRKLGGMSCHSCGGSLQFSPLSSDIEVNASDMPKLSQPLSMRVAQTPLMAFRWLFEKHSVGLVSRVDEKMGPHVIVHLRRALHKNPDRMSHNIDMKATVTAYHMHFFTARPCGWSAYWHMSSFERG